MTFLIRNQSRPIYSLFLLDHHGARTRVFFNLFLLLLLFYLCDHLPCSTAQIEEELPPPPTVNDRSSWGPRFNPSIAIIMVVLVSVFFLLGFFSVYIRRCAESRYPHHYNDPSLIFGGSTHRGRRGAPGLDASVINRFPTFPYSAVKGLKIGKGTLECAVCLNEFGDDETLRLIPKCSHVFHPDCIDAWLAGHTTCPVCRSNLLPEPGETIPSMNIQILNPDGSPGQPEPTSNYNEGILLSPVDPRVGVASPPDMISANQMKTPRSISRSPVWKFFHRSHSTGHSLVQPGEDHERFTLRLPEEVRNQLMNSSLVRTKSCVVLRSPRRGFRSRSIGFFYERFGRPSRPGLLEFCMTPPSFSKTRSPKLIGSSGSGGELTPPRNYLKSVRSPFRGRDTDGERSFDRLHNNNQV